MNSNITKALIMTVIMALSVGCDVEENAPMAASKSICSCLFVSKRSYNQCKFQFKKVLLLASISVNKRMKQVTSESSQKIATAQFVSEKFGCQITSLEDLPDRDHFNDR